MAIPDPATRGVSGFNWLTVAKLFVPSALGILIFFIPVTLGGRNTILLDHMVTGARELLGEAAAFYALALIVAGAAYPLWKGTWRRSLTDRIFTVLKLAGVAVAIMAMTGWGPGLLHEPDMLPFLFNRLVIPVGLIVPIGAVFLALLISYGLLELIGVLLQPVMRPIWRTPGRSAIDAVASFVGSYSIGLLITNRVYQAGQYSAREAAIIATGFSTVSATFMIIVARTLDLMSVWNLYFWLTLAITFAVTAVTVRLPPLSQMNNERSDGEPEAIPGKRLNTAWRAGLEVAAQAPGLHRSVALNVREGLLMAISILPSIMSVGLLGLLAAKYTPLFEWLGLLFYPFVAIPGAGGRHGAGPGIRRRAGRDVPAGAADGRGRVRRPLRGGCGVGLRGAVLLRFDSLHPGHQHSALGRAHRGGVVHSRGAEPDAGRAGRLSGPGAERDLRFPTAQ